MQQNIIVNANEIGKKRILDIILFTYSSNFSLNETIYRMGTIIM